MYDKSLVLCVGDILVVTNKIKVASNTVSDSRSTMNKYGLTDLLVERAKTWHIVDLQICVHY